jgi:hypothetical protein
LTWPASGNRYDVTSLRLRRRVKWKE